MCIDYRPLNEVTVKDAYPIPRIDEILDSLCGAPIFSTLDATSGYYQLAMNDSDIEKTAFSWKGGLYEFTRMLFGLCNVPETFQEAMDLIFAKEKWMFVIPYLDDIIIFSKNREEHEMHLKIILGKIKAHGLALNPGKCKFYKEEVKILGNVVSKDIIKPDPEKVQAIKNYTKPKTVKELRAFLCLASYCRDFIAGFTGLTLSLTDLLKNETKRSVKALFWSDK
jgi:Reverse transcriptase (RNA-dependent DNA polymerase)